jgi:hypothetical protein
MACDGVYYLSAQPLDDSQYIQCRKSETVIEEERRTRYPLFTPCLARMLNDL